MSYFLSYLFFVTTLAVVDDVINVAVVVVAVVVDINVVVIVTVATTTLQ